MEKILKFITQIAAIAATAFVLVKALDPSTKSLEVNIPVLGGSIATK